MATTNLNAEKIRAMSAGREMDALVAEYVMGWKHVNVIGLTYGEFTIHPDNGVFIAHATQYRVIVPWMPSTDIAAAWQVVEKMRTDGWSFACSCYHGEVSHASFCKKTAKSSRRSDCDPISLAICHAALIATLTEQLP